ncbi:hypothetical protein LJC46_03460 [Desulfovibrio sp. OttesenSCG-928-G15]|nr:hypothetical protein [Desulfovibrio sp. OttesenSCG-928-G15]
MRNLVYAHEHLTIDLAGAKNDPDCRLDDHGAALAELRALPRLGVTDIVDQTCRGMGRNPNYAQRLADEAGLRLLHATGYYKEPFLPEECYRLDERAMAGIFLAELRDEIAGTGLRATHIGEIGSGKDAITPTEEKIFRAAGRAHAETGAPVCTHTTLGALGLEQVALFREFGVNLGKVVLSHIDLSGDTDYMQRLLDTGVNIAFDTVGKNAYQPDNKRAEWLALLCRKGYVGQILLSVDITRKSHYAANGGPGYATLLEQFAPLAREAGCTEEDLATMLRDNPARVYSIALP